MAGVKDSDKGGGVMDRFTTLLEEMLQSPLPVDGGYPDTVYDLTAAQLHELYQINHDLRYVFMQTPLFEAHPRAVVEWLLSRMDDKGLHLASMWISGLLAHYGTDRNNSGSAQLFALLKNTVPDHIKETV